jgi:hypothetical protein
MEISKKFIISKINMFYDTSIFEYLVLCLLLFALWFILQRNYFSYVITVIFGIGGVIFYIFLKKYHRSETNDFGIFFPDAKNKRTVRIVTTIIFLIFFCIGLLSLLQGFYTKNVDYYLSVAVCAGMVILDIFFIENDRHAYFNLIKSYLLGLIILFSNHIVYPAGISLPDFGLHFTQFVLPILETGHISTISHIYQFFPTHHILSVVMILVSGFPAKMTYLFLGSLLISFGIFFVFIIGKTFVNIRFGCIAALVFCFLDYYIMYGTHPEHQAYNYAIALFAYTVLLFTYKNNKKSVFLLFLISSITLIFTHHLTAALILIVLLPLLCMDVIKNIVHHESTKMRALMLILIFLFILFLHFMYISSLFPSFIQILDAYQRDIVQSSIGRGAFDTGTAYDLLSFRTLFLNTLSAGILIFLSVIGFLSVFRKKSIFGYFLLLSGIFFALLLSFGIMFRHVALLPDRMYPALQVFSLLFLCSFGIIWIVQVISIKKPVFSVIVCIGVVMLMAFFSLSSTVSGFETSLFVEKNVAYTRVYDTQQEMNFATWKSDFVGKNVVLISSFPLDQTGRIDFSKFERNNYVKFDNFILRNGILGEYTGKFGQYKFIFPNINDVNALKSKNMYYDNGVISLLNVNNP